MTTTQGTEPTQVRQPSRATVRTILQVGLPTFLALPLIIHVIVDELGGQLPPGVTAWLLGAAAFLTALAATIARIMALPQVELLLRRLPDWTLLAAQPRPKPDQSDERGAIAIAPELIILAACALLAAVILIGR